MHDVYKQGYPALAYHNGDTLREGLSVVFDGPWPVVQLVTWNDYGEGTMIEPTHEFGYRFPELIQAARLAESATSLLTFTANDLRLPATLLAMRRAGRPKPKAELDHIAELLTRDQMDSARALMSHK